MQSTGPEVKGRSAFVPSTPARPVKRKLNASPVATPFAPSQSVTRSPVAEHFSLHTTASETNSLSSPSTLSKRPRTQTYSPQKALIAYHVTSPLTNFPSDTSSMSSKLSAPGSTNVIPGGIYQHTPEPEPSPPQVFQKVKKIYVVFWGRDDIDGIFENWYGSDGMKGAMEVTVGIPDAIHRSFNNHDLAHKAYQESKRTGVLAILKNKTPKEHFIVVEGENPGVYTRR
jgi:hypothetical protein